MKVTMKLASVLAVAGAVYGTASAAFAADVYQAPLEAAAAAPAPSPTWTIGFEGSPEWKVSDGTFADWYFKGSLSHSFGGGWSCEGPPTGELAEELAEDLYRELSKLWR